MFRAYRVFYRIRHHLRRRFADWSPTLEGARKIRDEDVPARLKKHGLEADRIWIMDPDGNPVKE